MIRLASADMTLLQIGIYLSIYQNVYGFLELMTQILNRDCFNQSLILYLFS